MKTINLKFTVLLVLSSWVTYAQKSGVYLSATDFESGKLTYEIDCSKEKHKIKLHEFLGKDYITVVHNKQNYQLKKKEIFDYMDCEGAIYRLGTDKHYQVINPTEKILLYIIKIPASKNQSGSTYFYFSPSATDEIRDLTLENLKRAFPDNHKFHDALDAEFSSGNNLARYDSFHKMYKVNRIYLNSVSN